MTLFARRHDGVPLRGAFHKGAGTSIEFDWILLFTFIALALVATINLGSFPRAVAEGKHTSQLIFFLGCSAIAGIFVIFDYRHFTRFVIPAYLGSLLLLVLPLVAGPTINGARRWVFLGSMSFQPSEISKLGLILFTAWWLARRNRIHEGLGFADVGLLFVVLLPPLALILKEPDLGTAMIHLFIVASMMLFAKINWKVLLVIAAIGAGGVTLGVQHLKPYQRDRLTTFLDPEADPKNKGYQALQAKYAVGSGQLLGKQYRQGTQTQLERIPEQHTDFIFTGWAEEWGFWGSVFLLSLLFFLIAWGISIVRHARDRFGSFLAMGCVSFLFWHVVINVGMVIGLLPVVGVPLPFMSYGGSSVFAVCLALGVLMNVSIRRNQ